MINESESFQLEPITIIHPPEYKHEDTPTVGTSLWSNLIPEAFETRSRKAQFWNAKAYTYTCKRLTLITRFYEARMHEGGFKSVS